MARRRRIARISRSALRPQKAGSGKDPDAELNGLLLEVLEPTAASEEEDEELGLVAVRRQVAESVGAPVSTCATLFLHGGNLLFERTVPDCPLILGRHPASDMVVPDRSVSRRHAELTYRDDAWFIRDLDSTSGTEVSGERVTGTTRLREGDRVKLGKFELSVSFSPPTEILGEEGDESGDSEKGPSHSDAPDETPVLAADLRDADSDGGVPTIVSTHKDEEKEDGESIRSGRAAAKKRQIDIQDRKTAENIKTAGILGVAVIALFCIVGIVGTVNRSPKPAAQPSPEQAVTPAVSEPGSDAQAEEPSSVGATPAPKVGTSVTQTPETPPDRAHKAQEPTPAHAAVPPAPEAETVNAQTVAEAEADDAKAAAAVERLPDLPEPLPADVSPFEPRWFAGPGSATVITQTGETVKGRFRIEGGVVHVDAAGVVTTMQLAEIEHLVWDGSRGFPEADALLEGGDYGRAAEKYTQAIREAEASLRAAGADLNTFAGRWYAEGRRRECLLKADRLQYCRAVFDRTDLASPEQLNVAGNSFARLATSGCVSRELFAKFESLLAEGRFVLEPAARDCWVERKRRSATAKKSPEPPAPEPSAIGHSH